MKLYAVSKALEREGVASLEALFGPWGSAFSWWEARLPSGAEVTLPVWLVNGLFLILKELAKGVDGEEGVVLAHLHFPERRLELRTFPLSGPLPVNLPLEEAAKAAGWQGPLSPALKEGSFLWVAPGTWEGMGEGERGFLLALEAWAEGLYGPWGWEGLQVQGGRVKALPKGSAGRASISLEGLLRDEVMDELAGEESEDFADSSGLSLAELVQRLRALGVERLRFRYSDDSIASSLEVLEAFPEGDKAQDLEALLEAHFSLTPGWPTLPLWVRLLGVSVPETTFEPPGGKVDFLMDLRQGTLSLEVVQYQDEEDEVVETLFLPLQEVIRKIGWEGPLPGEGRSFSSTFGGDKWDVSFPFAEEESLKTVLFLDRVLSWAQGVYGELKPEEGEEESFYPWVRVEAARSEVALGKRRFALVPSYRESYTFSLGDAIEADEFSRT